MSEAVLVERGYRNTTVDEIADRAGITKPVIYDHFTSKDDLVGAVITRAHKELETATIEDYNALEDPADARAFIYASQLSWFTFIDHHKAGYALLRQDGALSRGKVERIRVKQAELVAEALRQTREFAQTDDERLNLMATMLVGASERYALWRMDRDDITPEAAAEAVTDLVWSGIRPRD